jgi:hypothetical protein
MIWRHRGGKTDLHGPRQHPAAMASQGSKKTLLLPQVFKEQDNERMVETSRPYPVTSRHRPLNDSMSPLSVEDVSAPPGLQRAVQQRWQAQLRLVMQLGGEVHAELPADGCVRVAGINLSADERGSSNGLGPGRFWFSVNWEE